MFRKMTNIWHILLFYLSIRIADCIDYQLNLNEYHSYEEMTNFLNNFSRLNYNLTRLYTIGKSHEGREMWALEISAMKDKFLKPNVKLVANIHGNELVGKELLLHLAKYLVLKYNEGDSRIRRLLDFARVHLLPSMNPDGAELAMNRSIPGGPQTCTSGSGRNNKNDFDLNRNFPDQYRHYTKIVQVETVAVKQWLKDYPFVLSASLHGGALVASYPFDNKKENDDMSNVAPDDDVFQHLALVYAQNHPTMHKGVICHSTQKPFKNGITNGATWYSVTGGMQDYNYVKHGCMEITLEISCCKFPNASELPNFWDDNREPLLAFLEEVWRGVRGVVMNKEGVGISNANLQVLGRKIFFHTSSKGEFWRILLPGAYYLHVGADGFENQTVVIEVPSPPYSKWTPVINITLHSIGSQQSSTDQENPTTVAHQPVTSDIKSTSTSTFALVFPEANEIRSLSVKPLLSYLLLVLCVLLTCS